MKGKRIPANRRWEIILDFPICFSDWNCLTPSFKYGDGKSYYSKCRWREECRAKCKEKRLDLQKRIRELEERKNEKQRANRKMALGSD